MLLKREIRVMNPYIEIIYWNINRRIASTHLYDKEGKRSGSTRLIKNDINLVNGREEGFNNKHIYYAQGNRNGLYMNKYYYRNDKNINPQRKILFGRIFYL